MPNVDLAQTLTDVTIAEVTHGNAGQPKEDGREDHDMINLPPP